MSAPFPEHNARLACVVCTPLAKVTGPTGALVYDPISPLWHRHRMGLSMGTNINVSEICVDGLEVGDARSRVAARCLAMKPKPFCLLFIDSDVLVPADGFTKLFYWMKSRPEIDVCAGVYCVKGAFPYDPLIYRENGEGAFWDWAVGDLLTTKQHNVRATHMGLTLIRCSLFDRMVEAGVVHGDGQDQDDEPFFKTESYRQEGTDGVGTFKGTEDIYFFKKARKIPGECQILIDTSVLAGHHDKATGINYGLPANTLPIERAKWLTKRDRKEADEEDLLLAIDLGAGESRREWDGYKVYTLDAYKDSGADYVQEMTQLNLPSGHYDLVASRHSFEHVGRFQQEQLWAETFRIARPGARLEVIVPSLQWAAEKIVAGEMDYDTLNVLFGSQDLEEGWGKEGNHHLFGFTKEVAQALAEGAGWTDVKCVDWRDNPDQMFHMMITGVKPGAADPAANGETHHADNGRGRHREGAETENGAGRQADRSQSGGDRPAPCRAGAGRTEGREAEGG